MLSEYALEPDLLNSYESCRYFLEKFGIAEGRLLVQMPSNWLRSIYAMLLRERAAGRFSELQASRVESMLANIKAAVVNRRLDRYRAEDCWLVNAENEHTARPFRAIVAKENPRACDFVLNGHALDESNALWKVARGMVVPRTAVALAAATGPLLRMSETLVFVDKHFGPENRRHREVLREVLRASVTDRTRDPLTVLYFTGTAAVDQFFLDTCRGELPEIIPAGLTVRFAKLAERPGGQKFHNRYVLTEKGGISISTGLDLGHSGETDDVFLLEKDQYVQRWNDYMGTPAAFDLACDITLTGTAIR